MRAGHVVAAGDVDGAQQGAGERVVHRGGRAAPRLDRTAEVLAAVDLDGVVDGERGAGGVGAGDVLGPAGALDEVHAGGLAAQPGVALHPQHPAAGVGDRDDHLVGLGVLDQQPADHRHDRRQRVGGAVGEQLVVEQLDRRRAARRGRPRCPGSGATSRGRPTGRRESAGSPQAGDQPLVGGTQPPGVARARARPSGSASHGIHGRGHRTLRGEWLMSRPSWPLRADSTRDCGHPVRSRATGLRSRGGRAGRSAVGSPARAAPHHSPAP